MVDKEIKKDLENKIEPDQDVLNGVPTANNNGRDGTNKKQIKIIAIIVVGVLIMLVGLGIAAARYQDNKVAQKAEEAEKAAQDAKKIADSGSVNIAEDQQNIANSNFEELPPPEGLNEVQPEVEVAQNQQEIVQPVASPTYTKYDSSLTEPDPVSTTPQVQNTFAEVPAQVVNAPVQIADNPVLVDVYSAKAALSANSSSSESGLANNLKSSKLVAGNASKAINANLKLAKGTAIPCVLKTRIDSTYQGFTTCHVAKDVYSANGKTLLIERGSTVFGEQAVDLKQGQARVAVLWSKIETPKGISVDIDSPAAGQLGEMGIGAKVNNHFWKRFGGAIMLSLIKDISANASTQLSKDQSSENTVNNTSSSVEGMAEKILENTINIPPTATVKHGNLITILVVRDVNFGGLYDLRNR